MATDKRAVLRFLVSLALIFCLYGEKVISAEEAPADWRRNWPRTDFSRSVVPFSEIMSGGPGKDGIPSIDFPVFKRPAQVIDLADQEPVVVVTVGGDSRAYPVRILIHHEIVNDVVGGKPIAATFCPLCNASLVYERALGGRTLAFGTTGKLRRSDLVMYDRQTDSWWQQFSGEGIVGSLAGERLRLLPSRVESFAWFKSRHPDGRVLVPNNSRLRDYGSSPYPSYDSSSWPFLFQGEYKGPVPPMTYVVAIGNQAWPLPLLRAKRTIQAGELTLRWQPGLNSVLDRSLIAQGRDLGNVTVLRSDGRRGFQEVPYFLPFAFAFLAFNPSAIIHTR